MDFFTVDHFRFLDVVILIRAYCVICIIVIVAARLVPASRERFLTYGARGRSAGVAYQHQIEGRRVESTALLDWLASVEVPHSWFTHFYVLSLLSSFFWLTQTTLNSEALHIVAGFVPGTRPVTSKGASLLCTSLMVLQSARRLWESHMFSKASESKMWVGHYVFGLSFYSVVNVAVWIEGIHAITALHDKRNSWTASLGQTHIITGSMLFFTSSFMQFSAHAHLARLQKYSVPRHPLFRYLIAPHYFFECVIYLALAIIAAPEHYLFNRTLLSVALLTTVNLSITAKGTKRWMIEKFRDDRKDIQKKYCIIPGVL